MIVGLYARVSTDEQKKFGLSIAQQIEDLKKWAEENNMVVYDIYVDEGKSAASLKRPELQRLLADIQAKRVEKLVCTKLDRLTRQPRDYYKIMDMIEPSGGSWQTIQEDYDTSTTNGRFLVNIKMSMAEAELGATSDRIKAVFKGKKERGEVCSGIVPLGYKIENKHLVIDTEIAQQVVTYFECFERHGTLLAAYREAVSKGYKLTFTAYRRMITNELYAGRRYGNENYCPAIITPERFDFLQSTITPRSRTSANPDRIYIFTGLVFCGKCGHALSSRFTTYPIKKTQSTFIYKHYRCISAKTANRCSNNSIGESIIENYLLSEIRTLLQQHIVDTEKEAKVIKKKKNNSEAIQKKIERLQDVYIEGGLTKEAYEQKKAKLQGELLEASQEEKPQRKIEEYKDFLSEPFEELYTTLDDLERRQFWRRIIDKLVIHPKDDSPRISVFFK